MLKLMPVKRYGLFYSGSLNSRIHQQRSIVYDLRFVNEKIDRDNRGLRKMSTRCCIARPVSSSPMQSFDEAMKKKPPEVIGYPPGR